MTLSQSMDSVNTTPEEEVGGLLIVVSDLISVTRDDDVDDMVRWWLMGASKQGCHLIGPSV